MQRSSILIKGLLSLMVLSMASCSRAIPFSSEPQVQSDPVEVGFCMGQPTRTTVASNGKQVSWTNDDKIALWALNSSGQWTLSAQIFRIYGKDSGWARFTSILGSPMPEDRYSYVACYPIPASISGTVASFDVPSAQNGKVSDGVDVMLSNKVEADALRSVAEKDVDLNLQMKHLVHLLNFYLPSGSTGLEGEQIKKIKIKMPSNVCGQISVDVAADNPEPVYSATTESIVMELAEPLKVPALPAPQYASAAILPTSFGADDKMEVKVFSDSWIGTMDPIALNGRSFQAGHATPIKLKITDVSAFYSVKVKLATCNLGENPTKITLSVPDGKWGDTGSSIYVYNPGGEIPVGTTLSFSFEDYANYLTLSNKTLTVTYESEHVICGQTLQIPALEAVHSATVNLTVPYLMNENFSSVPSFSSNDAYSSGFNTGSKDPYSFLSGWTGGRVGAEAGKCIRIAGRRETSARYAARVDSAPLPQIKSQCNLSVSFTYGTNNQYSSSLSGSGDVPQTVYIGYVTNTKGYKSGDEDGVYESGNSFDSSDKNGSYSSTPVQGNFILTNVPAGNSIRISWRNIPHNKAGANNTTSWLYIDNVIVQISK